MARTLFAYRAYTEKEGDVASRRISVALMRHVYYHCMVPKREVRQFLCLHSASAFRNSNNVITTNSVPSEELGKPPL